jgi:hypothetical protein
MVTAMRRSVIRETPETAWARLRVEESDVEDVPVIWQGDVAVIGGGSAGCSAAVAAARSGSSTVVVESGGFLGGTASAVLDTMYGFYAPGGENRVVGGIAWEVASSLIDKQQAFLRPNTYGAGTGVTYEPEALKAEWDSKVLDSGAEPLLHARMSAAIMRGPSIVGIVVLTRRGPFRILAKRCIDATGDADVAWASGCALEMPTKERQVQPLTATFRLGGVTNPADTGVLHSLMREGVSSGEYRLPRVEGSAHRTVNPGIVHTNMTRVSGIDATDPWAYTAAEIEGRSQVAEYTRFLKERVPGYEESFLLNTSVWIGTRETRRLIGRYILTREDVLQARQFDDAIALCGAPVEDHGDGESTIWQYVGETGMATGLTYGVPYRCLLPIETQGLLVAGRCLSATHDAHASVRSIAQCMALGQAAGTAATMSLQTGKDLDTLDTQGLRQRLVSEGVVL